MHFPGPTRNEAIVRVHVCSVSWMHGEICEKPGQIGFKPAT